MSRMTDQIGRVLSGRYRLIAPLGTGASAQVYLADDVRLRRRVAVKLLHAALADDEAFLRRFRAEAQAAAALSHPNIVAVYDWGDDDGRPYIITEYLSGGSLRTVLDDGGRLTQSQALLVGLEATRALDYAHRRGFVHRDVKPANLLFGEDGRLRIADFGLARALAEAAWTEPQGAVLGTARYASPEQAQGESVDGRADVYSLGLVLIEAVTGSVPFAADTTIATLMGRVGKPVVVPDALGPLQKPLQRAGQPLPADRPDAGELAIALMACAEDLPRPEPLQLLAAAPVVDLTVGSGDDPDATMLGSSAHAPSRLLQPGDATVTDVPAVASGPAPQFMGDGYDDGYDDTRRRRRWPVVVGAVVLAALLGIGAAWAVIEARLPTYEVPVLVGNTEEAARNAVDGYGWTIDRRTERKDGSEPGKVLRTEPAAGEQLKKGDKLILFVSLGNTLAAVPGDLVGRTLDDATAALQAAGGFVPKLTEVFDETQAAGIVLAVAPETSGDQPKGSEIALTVSRGPEPRTVPSGLAGKSYDEAAAAITGVQLVPVKVEEFSDTIEAGKVIGLRPGEGQPAARDSNVEVVVSRGPDLVAVPSVAGKDLKGAVAVLEAAGLQAGDVFGPANGQPFDTDPRAGTMVKRGSSVDIYMRR
jgi:beta-lactam-binding protein with PASTA domain/tRNA A-37 threonylcarbamoyl transferase component Bud32